MSSKIFRNKKGNMLVVILITSVLMISFAMYIQYSKKSPIAWRNIDLDLIKIGIEKSTLKGINDFSTTGMIEQIRRK